MKRQCITRIWHGQTKADHADEYLQFVIDTGVADYKSVAGNLSVEIWRQIEGDVCHFWTVTKWDGYESIKKFAGEDLRKPSTIPKILGIFSNSNLPFSIARHSNSEGA